MQQLIFCPFRDRVRKRRDISHRSSVNVLILILLLSVLSCVANGSEYEYEARLVGDGNRGYLELNQNDQGWMKICPDVFDSNAADVACKTLGYSYLCMRREVDVHETDLVDEEFLAASPRCRGREKTLADCAWENITLPDSCRNRTRQVILTCANDEDVELRLAGGYIPSEGVPEVRCHAEDDWSTICAGFHWDIRDCWSICRHMGHKTCTDWRGDWAYNATQINVLYSQPYCSHGVENIMQCGGNRDPSACDFQKDGVAWMSCGHEVTVLGEERVLCGSQHTCMGRCGDWRRNSGGCQCDSKCEQYTDCCIDFQAVCKDTDPADWPFQDPFPKRFAKHDYECIVVDGYKDSRQILTIGHCPTEHVAVGEGTRRLCEDISNSTDVMVTTPVSDASNIVYKNIFCAICHGLRIRDIINWEVISVFINSNMDIAEDAIFGRPLPQSRHYQPTDTSREMKGRPCAVNVVDTCEESFEGNKTEELCGYYYAPIVTTTHYQLPTYTNPECRICNGHDYNEPPFEASYCHRGSWRCLGLGELPCRFTQRIQPHILSMPSGFSYDNLTLYEERANVDCSGLGQIYDPFLGVCRVLNCPVYYEHVEDRCVPSEAPYGNIEVQLTGFSERTGRVEVSHEGLWYRACDQFFDPRAASVMCRQLGYSDYCTYTSGRSREILVTLDLEPYTIGVECQGDETSLAGCQTYFTYDNSSLCETEGSEVIVSCTDGNDLEMRLTGSTIPSEGFVQMRCDRSVGWGYLHGGEDHWDIREGKLACTHMGFDSMAYAEGRPVPEHEEPTPVVSRNMFCGHTDTNFFECEYENIPTPETETYAYLSCGFEAVIHGETVFLCGSEHTCNRRCGSWGHGCSCDEHCEFFRDCCFDYEKKCSRDTSKWDSSIEHFPTTVDLDQYVCISESNTDLYAVGFCSPFWIDDQLKQFCEDSPDSVDITAELPVYDQEGVVYKNLFCALCNGAQFHQLTTYTPIFQRNDSQTIPDSFENYRGFHVPSGPGRARTCTDHFSPCAAKTTACNSFYAPTVTGARNPTCFSCTTSGETRYCSNDECDQAMNDHSCENYMGRGHLLMLFDFTDVDQGRTNQCEGLGEIFDPFLGQCRFMGCPLGFYYSVGQCVEGDLPYNAPQVVLQKTVNESAMCAQNILSINRNEIVDLFVTPGNDASNDTGPFAATVIAESLLASFSLKITLDNILLSDVSRVNVYYMCGIATFLLAVDGTSNGKNISDDCLGEELAVFRHKKKGMTQTQNVFSYEFNTRANTFLRRDLSDICWRDLNVELSCVSTSTVDPSTFHLTPSRDSVEIELQHATVVVPSAEFQMLRNGSLRVCSEKLNARSALFNLAYTICISLSIVGMTLTFITYQTFPKLRNVPGMCLMNLVAALFIANLLFLFNDEFTSIPGVCVVVGAASHFAWLASFAWMSILSFNMARTFGAQSMQLSTSSNASSRLFKYSLYAWGLPFLFTAGCLFVHFCECIDDFSFQYGGTKTCWISDGFAVLVTVGVPVALILIFDLGAFLFTGISLRTNRNATKHMRNRLFNDVLMELAVNARLFILMGMTWIFGFIQEFWPLPVWQITFLISNSLQGIFIFIMFVMKKRVIKMWTDFFKKSGTDYPTTPTTRAMEGNNKESQNSHHIAVVSNDNIQT